jgi:hypothetical protein
VITADDLKNVKLKNSRLSITSQNNRAITLKDITNVKLRTSGVHALRRSPRLKKIGENSPAISDAVLKLRKINKSPGGTPVRKDGTGLSSPLLRAIQNKFKVFNS